MEIYEGKEKYIFISYAHKDSDIVLPIVETLWDNNFRVWYDAGIEAGSEWPENVAEHLCNSELVLVFLSQNALDSQNCIREIHFAIAERKNILVIHLEDLKLSVGMRMQLGPLQALFFKRHKTKKEFLQALLTAKILSECKKPQREAPIEPPSSPIFPTPKPRRITKTYTVPLELFEYRDSPPTVNTEDVENVKKTILETLAYYKIKDVKVFSVLFGPTVTSYKLILPRHVSPHEIIALNADLCLALRFSEIKIYPVHEDGTVCVEIPNKKRSYVSFAGMLSDEAFVNAPPTSLTFAMGKDVFNRNVYGDISKMVHMLVAGATGTGKSIFFHSLITSLIYKYSPEELRLILIDPKMVEFTDYEGLPHLLFNEITKTSYQISKALNFAVEEMERRYALFKKMQNEGNHTVNIDQYNAQVEQSEILPKIVVLIDELADLMLWQKEETEDCIMRIAQKARAAGIFLIVATQRPTPEVITGAIKSNLPTRIAFKVATQKDSRVILDQAGAEKLLDKGDLLYQTVALKAPVRVQSAYISPTETKKVVDFIKTHYKPLTTNNTTPKTTLEPLYDEALRYAIFNGNASIAMIQRKCGTSFRRASEVMEWMEEMGYVSPHNGSKPRKVLITKEEFESKYGPL